MSLERLMNYVWHKAVPQRPSEISAVRWSAMVKSAENRLQERIKSFYEKTYEKTASVT